MSLHTVGPRRTPVRLGH